MKFPGIDKKCFPIEDLSEIESMSDIDNIFIRKI